LTALIEAKREGKTFIEEEAPKRAPVIDMMEALKRSLHESEALKRKKPMLARPGREREGRRRLAS
jgi:non-homologous end joining protein Ku